ncbi:16S rRNA (uracil(1498)-N(3))-methyltransferase [Pseudomarimonas salicorniae]|uniref:Ribosomal RNA small subunit methyltransferase E n=1 Tax=Pseudomarimonas salicorniae TaxID=2933270 RepID=A0ABT0GDZ3_9GAMM|nr:16S rRNA (uracil(1498)-N(3))-methyltransferase [Lysobacter sp. CAU 1642]MCK7592775.1 16S rRNA (uracil(1498)-N(3))-methyltransferase [Lysobacter sp. CAU 1642]
MREVRCFVDLPLAEGASMELPDVAAGHLVRVLRLGPGAAVTLFNGDGFDYPSTVEEARKQLCRVRVGAAQRNAAESALSITLLQGVARGEKMDLILQKACELGVAEIWPVITERTEVRLDGERAERRHAHWLGVLRGAAEQSGRARVPRLAPLESLSSALARLPAGQRLTLSPGALAALAALDLDSAAAVQLLIGPEGGLGERDLQTAAAAGFTPARLGPRVLRTETAGLTALAVLQARWGDLG